MGKGSRRRPAQITDDEYAERWKLAFGEGRWPSESRLGVGQECGTADHRDVLDKEEGTEYNGTKE